MAKQLSILKFCRTENEPKQMAASLINSIIDTVIQLAVKKQKRHTGAKVQECTESKWMEKYPWLQITTTSDDTKLLHCTACKQAGKANAMATKGSPNLQLSTIRDHGATSDHQDAEKKNISRKRAELESLFDCDSDIDIDDETSVSEKYTVSASERILFQDIYFAAKSEMPSEIINKLLKFDKLKGLDVDYENLSWTTINEIQVLISDVLRNDLIKAINQCDCVGVMIDESCDIAVEKRLVICLRYVSGGVAKTSFLANVKVPDGKAHTITYHVNSTFQKYGINMGKIVSLGTDGAAVMTGRRMGVGVQIQSKYSPFVTQVHCMAHRLALGCLDSLKGMKTLETFKSRFNSVYIQMSGSAVKSTKLKEIQNLLHDDELKCKEPHTVRWLSLRSAIEAVFRCYASVVTTLSELGAEGNTICESLHKYFGASKTALLTGFMLDIHNEIAMLSCDFQREDIVFSEIKPAFESTLAGLEVLKSGVGTKFTEMKTVLENEGGIKGVTLSGDVHQSIDEVKTLMSRYIDRLKENIADRLTQQNGDVIHNLGAIFEPTMFDEELADGAISDLATFYGTAKTVEITDIDNEQPIVTVIQPLLHKENLLQEWPRFKGMLKGTYKNYKTPALCQKIIVLHSDRFPNMAVLSKIALSFCLTSVPCERVFSVQNRLKSKFRSSMKEEKLDCLMYMRLEGPDIKDFDPSPAIRLWNNIKDRRHKRLAQPYKPRAKKAREDGNRI